MGKTRCSPCAQRSTEKHDQASHGSPSMTIKLTKTSIATLTLPPGKSDAIFFDSEVPGFGLRIRAGGSRKWIVQYQLHGHQQRRLTIGSVAVFDAEQARRAAREMLAKARLGEDPQAQKFEASIAAK